MSTTATTARTGSKAKREGIEMNTNTRRRELTARGRRARVAKLVLAGVLFAGLFVQIGMLAGISAQSKELDAVGKEIVELNARRDNLELSLSMLKNPERIEQLALQMGMERPTEDAIRVVSLALTPEDAQTQTAELPGGEGVVQ